MITGIALILIAVYVEMPKAIMITLCVFGSIKILGSLIKNGKDSAEERIEKR